MVNDGTMGTGTHSHIRLITVNTGSESWLMLEGWQKIDAKRSDGIMTQVNSSQTYSRWTNFYRGPLIMQLPAWHP